MSDNKSTVGFFTLPADPNQIPVVKLAFLGDAVLELMVREFLTENLQCHFRELNAAKIQLVNATSQATAAEKILPMLNEEEICVYRRGKNCKHKNFPKTASIPEYCKATGLETLMGYLYLKGNKERLSALFAIVADGLQR